MAKLHEILDYSRLLLSKQVRSKTCTRTVTLYVVNLVLYMYWKKIWEHFLIRGAKTVAVMRERPQNLRNGPVLA